MPVHTTPWHWGRHIVKKPIFAIGDVHGRLDLLEQLHATLDERLAEVGSASLVRLGDYIDRGPQSIETLEAVFAWERPGVTHHILPGNHEQMMLMFLADPHGVGSWWFANGGYETVGIARTVRKPSYVTEAITLQERLGRPLLDKIKALPAAVRIGGYFFVHAGIPLGRVSLEQIVQFPWQKTAVADELDPLWVRDGFLKVEAHFEHEVRVIHGHTPTSGAPDIRSNRINIDTGAYRTGNLCMIEISDERFRFHIATENAALAEKLSNDTLTAPDS